MRLPGPSVFADGVRGQRCGEEVMGVEVKTSVEAAVGRKAKDLR
jgi:hypothetical protein